MQSKATTVEQYMVGLPADRRATIEAVRRVILKNLPKGVSECVTYGMIGYAVPHSVYPKGYHCDPKMPLPFASLASQKNHCAIYLMNLYTAEDQEWLRTRWEAAGKKLDMGKSCVRFRTLDDLPLDVVGEAIARVTVAEHIANYEAALSAPRTRPTKKASGKKAPGKTPAAKKTAKKAGTKKTTTKTTKRAG